MEFDEPGEALLQVERLRTVARADRRPSSVPLLVFGVLTVGYAPWAESWTTLWTMLYWAIAGPVGFLLVGWWYRQRRMRIGVGGGRARYVRTGLILLACFALVLPLTIMALPTVGMVLLVIAWREHNRYLGVFAAVLAAFGFLTAPFSATLENAMYRTARALGWFRQTDGYFNGATQIVYVTAGLLLLAGGLVALRRERRASA